MFLGSRGGGYPKKSQYERPSMYGALIFNIGCYSSQCLARITALFSLQESIKDLVLMQGSV